MVYDNCQKNSQKINFEYIGIKTDIEPRSDTPEADGTERTQGLV